MPIASNEPLLLLLFMMAAEGGNIIIRFTYTGENNTPDEATHIFGTSQSFRLKHSLVIITSLKSNVMIESKRLKNGHLPAALP